MSAATTLVPTLNNTVTLGQPNASIWRRMFDAWVRSYEARISPDGKVFYGSL
jgi:hypothetical protein